MLLLANAHDLKQDPDNERNLSACSFLLFYTGLLEEILF